MARAFSAHPVSEMRNLQHLYEQKASKPIQNLRCYVESFYNYLVNAEKYLRPLQLFADLRKKIRCHTGPNLNTKNEFRTARSQVTGGYELN